ncbi:MAG: hypothetical protein O7A69_01315, partial [SAR324 cluster bacterium]|nr:hypothetical protein [SAR324 cluster bacterium]
MMIVLCCAAAALLLLGCAEAEDLGDAPPDATVIRSGNISWVEGIGNIFLTKCGSCHNPLPDASVPRNVPTDLDLTKYQGDGLTFRGALDIFPFIRAGILVGDLTVPPVPRMPLSFSTPLTESELRNIVLWIEAGGPSGVGTNACAPPVDDTQRDLWEQIGQNIFSNGQSSGASACVVCHATSHYSRLDCPVLRLKVEFMYDSVA